MAFRVQKYLRGLRYPTRKTQAIWHAFERDADEEVLGVLLRLPERVYESPVSLARSLQ